MGSRRQQGASFTPLRGGDVDGIDNVDPEAPYGASPFSSPFSAERPGSRPTERTPVLSSGPRGPRRSGGKKLTLPLPLKLTLAPTLTLTLTLTRSGGKKPSSSSSHKAGPKP